MLRVVSLILLLCPVACLRSAAAQPSAAPRMLVIDYAMGYPEENAGVMSVFAEAGFEVHYRQYYPALVGQDALRYDAIVLMGGGDPGMSLQEADLAINFVSRGKLLVLAMPPDTEYGGARQVNAGARDRYMFNLLLNRLNIKLYAFALPGGHGLVFTPVVGYEPASGHPVSEGLSGPVAARAATRILVGAGAEPLLVEPEAGTERLAASEAVPSDEKERKVRIRRQQVRIQPTEALPEEDIDLILRGDLTLRVWLHYRSSRPPVPVDWTTAQCKGRVVGVAGDTVTVRVPGTRWGSDYGLVRVPAALAAVAFVEREVVEAIGDAGDPEKPFVPAEDAGRLAVAAVGRGDRLEKGHIMVVDRDLLNALSRPAPPFGLETDTWMDPARLTRFLVQLGRYARTLAARPSGWSPVHPYPPARIPGVQEPDFPLNQTTIASTLPERVTVLITRTGTAHLHGAAAADTVQLSPRGVWDYVARADSRTDSLLSLLPSLGFNFVWTTAPATSFIASDSTAPGDLLFTRWGPHIARRLSGSGIQWYVGIGVPEEEEEAYPSALDARGTSVAMPSLLDVGYWKDHLFDPAGAMARFSATTPGVTGIIDDWETHVHRAPWAYAPTDAFEEDNFRHYIRYAAQHGLYRGDAFETLQGLNGKQRFEWLMKAGRLEEYFRMLESRAERLGRLYRQTVSAIHPSMRYGSFMRRPRLSWFHIGFWRGASTPEHPHLVLTYEPMPGWYVRFLRDRGVAVQPVPVVPLGLLGREDAVAVLQAAGARGGYCLERGAWLVVDPETRNDLGTPPQGVTREQIIERLRAANERKGE